MDSSERYMEISRDIRSSGIYEKGNTEQRMRIDTLLSDRRVIHHLSHCESDMPLYILLETILLEQLGCGKRIVLRDKLSLASGPLAEHIMGLS